METENKIIALFLEDKKPKTIRGIAKHIHADYRITHTAAQRLLKKKILFGEIIGKSMLCTLNNSFLGIEVYTAEAQRKDSVLKKGQLQFAYKEIMTKVGTGLFVLLLFGSYAKRKQTKTSDIDLLFISNEAQFEEKITRITSLLPLKIHALVFTEEEFIRMKNAKKRNIAQEVIENNVILYGTETYYVIKNA